MEGGDFSMSNEIDTRIVEMQFDNQQFEAGVRDSVKSLSNLKEGLKLDESAKSLLNLQQIAQTFSLANISNGVDAIAEKFTAFGIMGVTMIQNLTNAMINSGVALVKGFTIDPVTAGMSRYEQKTIAVQTILNATGKTMEEVEKELEQLTWFSDETSYSFTDMTASIGKFTASNVDLATASTAVQGIATWAALSGQNATTASRAMYQLAQAIGSGTVRLQDWMSIEGSQMATEEFKQTAINVAKSMGMLSRVTGRTATGLEVTSANFRNTLSDGWFSKEVLLKTLNEYGEYTGKLYKMTQELGISTAEAMKLIDSTGMKLSEKAFAAARVARTFTDVVNATKDAVSSGWMETFEIIFGNFEEAKVLWTELSLTLWDIFASGKDARNAILQDWKDLGGRTMIIDTLRTAYQNLLTVVSPIQEAMSEIFPAITGSRLMEITTNLKELVSNFKMGEKTSTNLKNTFKGFFAVLDIGKQAFYAIASGVGSLIKILFPAVDGLLSVSGSIGIFLVSFRDTIKETDIFGALIRGLSSVLTLASSGIWHAINTILNAFSSLGTFDMGPLNSALGSIIDKFNPLAAVSKMLHSLLSGIVAAVEWLVPRIFKLADNVGAALTRLGNRISDAFNTGGFNAVAQLFNSGVFFGILMGIKKFFDTLVGSVRTDGGIVERISKIIDGVRGSLESYQNQIKADMILKIAIAIGILAAALLVLSSIEPTKLTAALTATSVLLMELMGALSVYQKATKGVNFNGVTKATIALVGISVAMVILSSAVAKLSSINVKDIALGLASIGVLFGELSLFVNNTSFKSVGVMKGTGLLVMAAAISVLASAVKTISAIDLPGLAKGLGAVGVIFASLSLFLNNTDFKSFGALKGTGLLIMATAILALTVAVKSLANIDTGNLILGLSALGVILAEINLFSSAMQSNKSLALTAVGITILGGAILIFASAVKMLGNTATDQLLKGLGTLGAMLAIIGVAAKTVKVSASWGGSLLVVAGALLLLSGALKSFAGMSLAELGTGLLAISGIFVVLGVAGLALRPLIPVLFGLGAAVALFGAGCFAVGAGVLAFATGLTALAAAGAGTSVAIVAIVTTLLGLIPMALRMMAEGIIAFAEVITRGAPAIVNAITTTLVSLMDSIIKMTPKIMEMLGVLLTGLIILCNQSIPQFIEAGISLLVAFMKGIKDNISQVMVIALQIVLNFLSGLALMLADVIQAGINLIVAFVNGIAEGIRNNTQPMIDAIINLMSALLEAAVEVVMGPVKGVFVIGKNLVQGIIEGINSMFPALKTAGENVGDTLNDATRDSLDINSPSGEGRDAGEYYGEGVAVGVDDSLPTVVASATNLADQVVDYTKTALGDATGLGEGFGLDLAEGMDDSLPKAIKASKNLSTKVVDAAQEAFTKYRKWIEDQKYYDKMTMADELNAWTNLQTQYAEGTEQRAAADKEVYRLQKEMAKNAISERKYYNELSLKEELTMWEEIQSKYLEGTEARKAADKEVYRLKKELMDADQAYSKKILDDEKAALDAKTQLNKDHFQRSKDINAKLRADIEYTYAAYDQAVANRADALYDSYGMFDKVAPLKDIDGTKLIANLQTQNAAFADWQTDIRALSSRGIDSGLITELQAMGPQAAKQVKALSKLTEPQLNQYVALWKTKHEAAKTQASFELRGMLTETYSIISKLKTQAEKDLNDSTILWENQMKDLTKTIGEQATDAKTAWMKQIGELRTETTAEFVAITEDIPKQVNSLDWAGLGSNIVSGITVGVKNSATLLVDEVVTTVKAALKAANEALGIESPSKEFEKIGMYSDMGFANGLKKFGYLVTNETVSMGSSAVRALSTVASQIADGISNNIDGSPTIRPVLDLTNVESGAGRLRTLLSNQNGITVDNALRVASYVNKDIQASKVRASSEVVTREDILALKEAFIKTNKKPGITQHLTINSPKALSPAETARQNRRVLQDLALEY